MFYMFSGFAISIHAAREGGDAVNYRNKNLSNISIHAAREGGDYNTAIPKRG